MSGQTMPPSQPVALDRVNAARYEAGQERGHYESFYQRANHPTKPWAFWIRYTLFSPAGRPEDAIGELWAVFFDGETGEHVVAKQEHPIADCLFTRERFSARVADAALGRDRLTGTCASAAGEIAWDLSYRGDAAPLLLLPERLYDTPIPKAKSLVGLPLATFGGHLVVNGRRIDVDGWRGSQNHNWGSRHTDHYAFGQVAGFDDAPDSFLEIVSAQVKLGPVQTPLLTFLVLRHDGREHRLVSLRQARRATASFRYFAWDFASATEEVDIAGTITAPAEAFVGLNYYNPPGGIKHCLNTKIGACELTVTDRRSGSRARLSTRHRALFEILTDDRSHGVPIRA